MLKEKYLILYRITAYCCYLQNNMVVPHKSKKKVKQIYLFKLLWKPGLMEKLQSQITRSKTAGGRSRKAHAEQAWQPLVLGLCKLRAKACFYQWACYSTTWEIQKASQTKSGPVSGRLEHGYAQLEVGLIFNCFRLSRVTLLRRLMANFQPILVSVKIKIPIASSLKFLMCLKYSY